MNRFVAQVDVNVVRVAVEEWAEVLERGLFDESRAILAEGSEQFHDVALFDLLVGELGQRRKNLDASLADTPDLIV